MLGQLFQWISKLLSILKPSGISATPSHSLPSQQSSSNRNRLIEMLRHEEGVRYKPYKDHLGYWTIGVGHLIDPRKGAKWVEGPLTDAQVDALLEDDIARVERGLPEWMRELDPVRYAIMVDMAFQMGVAGLMGFKNTLAHVRAGRYTQAADNMQQSLWYRQTPNRANRRIKEMITGEYHKYV